MELTPIIVYCPSIQCGISNCLCAADIEQFAECSTKLLEMWGKDWWPCKLLVHFASDYINLVSNDEICE